MKTGCALLAVLTAVGAAGGGLLGAWLASNEYFIEPAFLVIGGLLGGLAGLGAGLRIAYLVGRNEEPPD